ncbi:MarR family winged helix-turn-helix transcriptional regulator [Blastococcus haudaquaticus]|uniref:Transcriptional regulator, MarR family n=1 Tax=Blastococcus haudaquaticus TaxID=1938745 RepID=A0A286GFW7_9ACTN|nr:MarR family transcriptional regulator [Blastococcus haudaquaticus]SOD94413.1 transcriptional regulator, MarR family [Blastococcus haudaquaticus]
MSEDDRPAELRRLSEQLPRFMRLVHALKTQLAKNDNRDRAALVLLFPLARLGPLRQGALAELVHADPSTVSRHVAALVEQGLVHRVADESDGRASRLHVTDAGHAALETLRRERESHLDQVTAAWDDADLAALTTLFGRLLDDIATTLPGTDAGSLPTEPREIR